MAGKRGGDRWPVALGTTEASDVRRLRLSIPTRDDQTSGFSAGATPQVLIARETAAQTSNSRRQCRESKAG